MDSSHSKCVRICRWSRRWRSAPRATFNLTTARASLDQGINFLRRKANVMKICANERRVVRTTKAEKTSEIRVITALIFPSIRRANICRRRRGGSTRTRRRTTRWRLRRMSRWRRTRPAAWLSRRRLRCCDRWLGGGFMRQRWLKAGRSRRHIAGRR